MVTIQLHAISPEKFRRVAITRRLTEFSTDLLLYESVEEFQRVLGSLDRARTQLVIYVPPPSSIESYAQDLISLLAVKQYGVSVSVICMSTEEALVQSADVLNIHKLFYDSQETLKEQIGHIEKGKRTLIRRHSVQQTTLTPREQSVLIGLRAGLAIKEIATNLHISANTVSTYKLRIMQKRGYTNNAELLRQTD